MSQLSDCAASVGAICSPAGVTTTIVTAASTTSAAMAAPSFTRFIGPPSERESRADARDQRRHHAGCVTKRGARQEIGSGRRRRIQQIEDIEIDAEPPAAAQPEILVRSEVENVEGLEALRAVRLEPNRRVPVIGDRRAAVRVRLAEGHRALAFYAGPALKEAGNRHVVRQGV